VREIDLAELMRSAVSQSKEAAADAGSESEVAAAAKLAEQMKAQAAGGSGRTQLSSDGSAAVTDDLGELEKLMEMLADEEGDNGPAREG